MKHARRLVLLLILVAVAPSCDIALGVYFATKKSGGSSGPPAPDPRYHVFGATLTPGDETNERNAIFGVGGNPGSNWTLIDSSQVSAEFPVTGTTNAILIQTTVVQNYEIDAVEAFDVNGHLVGTFTVGSLFFDGVTSEINIPNRADGATALMAGTAGQHAFVFQILPTTATPIVKVRVYIKAQGGSPSTGDPIFIGRWQKPNDQEAGGAATNSSGVVYAGVTDVSGRAMWLAPFDITGSLVAGDVRNLETDVTVAYGGVSVAVDSGNNVIVANTSTFGAPANTSSIRLRKFNPTLTVPPMADTGLGASARHRVEAHGVTIDNSNNIIVAGGNDSGTVLTPQVDHWLTKWTNNMASVSLLWTQTPPTDTGQTWWRAVSTGPRGSAMGDTIVTAGDLTSSVLGPIDIFSRKTDAGNTVRTDAVHIDGGPGAETDLGRDVALDSSGNTYAGGTMAATGGTSSPVILKIANGSTTPAVFFTNGLNLPGEILGLAALPDGTVYAAGYETVSTPSQGKNLILLKITSGGAVVWKRTYDSGLGDDRGVSVALTSVPSPRVIVVGEAPTASNGVDILVIAYAQ